MQAATTGSSMLEGLKPFLILPYFTWLVQVLGWRLLEQHRSSLVMSSLESVGELSRSKLGQLNVCPCVDMGYSTRRPKHDTWL